MQFLTNLRLKYEKLMYGRHGFDKLCRDMIILWLIIGVINSFIRSRVVMLVALILPALAIWRMLSRETYKRGRENLKYMELKTKAIDFFKVQYRRVKEIKTHRYYKCKNCHSYLRVRRKKGTHTVCCPKCGKEFQVKIR